MSASDKKKLRKEQAAAELTEKQNRQAKEDKKTRAITIGFVVVMAVIVVATAAVMIAQAVNRSGVREKGTVAMTVGEHSLNSVEASYYYIDAINDTYSEWSNNYGDYLNAFLESMGLDTTKALDAQVQDSETGATWADYFIDMAAENARHDYALYDSAVKEGYTLPEDKQASIDNEMGNLTFYAQIYGYTDSASYLRAIYGNGAAEKSYRQYREISALADAYYSDHNDALTYDDAAIRAYDSEHENDFNAFTYVSSYLSYTYFQEGGTEDDEGNVTYSDEEKDAARAKVKEAAESLLTATTPEELDEAIKALDVNKEKTVVTATTNTDTLYTSIDTETAEWLSDKDRKENDITLIETKATTTDEDGKEVTNVNGYTVVMFLSASDNKVKMGDVRHILINFETDRENEDGSEVTEYTDEEKAAAKEEAEKVLETWKNGAADEEYFKELVSENSDDTGSVEDGGLYENIFPGSGYTENFRAWALDESRKPGDTGIVESENGYHIMYYVGDSKLNYRDYMISEELRTNDLESWYNGLYEATPAQIGDTKYLKTDMKLSTES